MFDPLKLFAAGFTGLFIGILVVLLVSAAVAGDWITVVCGSIGTASTAALGWGLLQD